MAIRNPAVLRHKGWVIDSYKGPILNATQIEKFEQELGFHLPEMVFGSSFIRFEHEASGCAVFFDALDALRACDSESSLQVASAKEWSARYILPPLVSACGTEEYVVV